MFNFEKKTADEHMQDLIDLHEKIKAHPFRIKFTDQYNIGTFRALFKEYRSLIYDTTEVLCALKWRCTDTPMLNNEDLFWVHDFRGWLFTLSVVYDPYHDDYLDKPIRGINMTARDVYAATGMTNINCVMEFLEKYVGYIHRFIETRKFDYITCIQYERVTNPHNGHYYKHMLECVKTETGWTYIKPPAWIGTQPRQL